MILFIIYAILGYWAAGRTIYRNTFLIYDRGYFMLRKLMWGLLGGWILIPWALIMVLLGK